MTDDTPRDPQPRRDGWAVVDEVHPMGVTDDAPRPLTEEEIAAHAEKRVAAGLSITDRERAALAPVSPSPDVEGHWTRIEVWDGDGERTLSIRVHPDDGEDAHTWIEGHTGDDVYEDQIVETPHA